MNSKERMIEVNLKGRGIKDKRVLVAFAKVKREDFVLEVDVNRAYADHPLQIGNGQTISQPYIVALTVEALKIEKTDKVLELGTGLGYEAAIIAELCDRLITIERIPQLAEKAAQKLNKAAYKNVKVVIGDGTVGYPEAAPYNAIAVSAAAPAISQTLINQLAPGGRMVIPVGEKDYQELLYIQKGEQDKIIEEKNICGCLFVPLIGKEGFREK